MSQYRRIEVNTFRRRVTIVSGVSGERSQQISEAQCERSEDGVLLQDSGLSFPVEPDSPEGQTLLVEAVRSLERRLSPEARATILAGKKTGPSASFRLRWWSLYRFIWPARTSSDPNEK